MEGATIPDDTNRDTVDANTEYASLSESLRTAVTLLWQALAAFFAVNALLFAGLGAIFDASFGTAMAKNLLLVGLTALGLVVSFLAPFAIRRFYDFIEPILERGKQLEADRARTMYRLKDAYDKQQGVLSAKWLSIIVMRGFALAWFFLFVSSVVALLRCHC